MTLLDSPQGLPSRSNTFSEERVCRAGKSVKTRYAIQSRDKGKTVNSLFFSLPFYETDKCE